MYLESLELAKEHYKKMYKQTFHWYYLQMLMMTLAEIAEEEKKNEKSKLQSIT